MEVVLLGTGGADGIPALFGDTRVSDYAREHGGKDVRTRSAALVDGQLKIDFGPDTWYQVTHHKLDARDWTGVFFTHSDADHFAIEELQYAVYPFNTMDYVGFTIYGNAVVCRKVLERFSDWPFELSMTKSFQSFRHVDHVITPVQANHMHGEDAQNFIIQKGGKTLLYGSDTGVWFEPTWEFLKDYKLDGLVIECCEGFNPTAYHGHMDVRDCIAVIERLTRQGTVDSDTVIYTTHHSHNGEGTHEELEKALNPHGIQVGYDGLKFTI